MQEIDINKWNRLTTYNFFKTFSNTTYSCSTIMDVTELVKYCKDKEQSFFINFLYIILKGLNSIREMRMRLVDDKVLVYDDINPAFTVLKDDGNFVNVRFKNNDNLQEFYQEARRIIDISKTSFNVEEHYNPRNCYDEYYITCLPWLNFSQVTHPIPDDKSSQCIPRICWGKYVKVNEHYEMTLNITVSHLLVDGYPLSQTFNKIQELLNNVKENEINKKEYIKKG